jgi:hypothetical protein
MTVSERIPQARWLGRAAAIGVVCPALSPMACERGKEGEKAQQSAPPPPGRGFTRKSSSRESPGR